MESVVLILLILQSHTREKQFVWTHTLFKIQRHG